MGLLTGKNGLVFGLANDKSIAWAIAQRCAEQGANLGFAYLPRMEKRVLPLAASVDAQLCAPCDVTDDAQLDAFFAHAADVFDGRVDFLVHAVAFADRADLLGRFTETRREGFALAMDVSAYSLVTLTRRCEPLMTRGGSVLTLSYYGAEKVVEGYKVMGVAKAALEANVRYLAHELGAGNVRVNAISAGPIKTLAAAGIPGFRTMLRAAADATPMRRNVDRREVADAALFLLSNMASGVTGEVLHVDAGYHIMGTPRPA